IGDRTQILDHCLVSESIMGSDGLIGMGSEVVRSVIGKDYVAHTGKFLDSIGGDGVHLAGNAETANQRLDKRPVTLYAEGEKVNTGLPKYGTAMGSFSALGPQSVTNPGMSIGRDTIVGALTEVNQNIGDTMLLANGQEPRPRQRLTSSNK